MATIAPDTTESAAPGWLGSFLADVGARDRARRSRTASPRPAGTSLTAHGLDRRTTSRAPPRPPPPAQPAWAATSYQERARVLRRAAEIYEANREEFGTWTQRETGAVAQQDAPRVELRLPRDPQRGDPAVAGRTARSCRRPCKGRLSMVRRVPAGVIGAITPWNSPTVLGMRVVGAGAGARQRGRPQAGPADAGRRRRDVRGGLPRGRPARGPAPGRRRWRRRRRGARHRPEHPGRVVHRLDRRRAAGRRSWRAACSRRSRSSSAATTRSSSSTTPTSTRPPRPGRSPSFQFQGQVCFAAGRHIVHRERRRRLHRRADREGEAAAHSATRTARTSSSARSSTRSSSPASTTSSSARSTGGARVVEGGTHEGLFYRPTVLTDVTHRHGRPGPTRSSARSRRSRVRHATRRRSRWPTPAATASSASIYSRSLGRGLAIADRMRTGMVHVNDGTLNDEATIPFGGMGDVGQRQPLRRRGQPRHVHRVAVGHGARRAADLPVLRRDRRGIHHRRRPAGRRLHGDRRRGSCRRRRTRSARRPASGCSTRPGRSTTSRTRSPAACSRATVPVVGVIVHDITDPYFAEVVRGVEDAASVGGYLVITCSSDRIAERERSYVRLLRSMRAATVIFAGSGLDDPALNAEMAKHLAAMRAVRRGGRPPLAARLRRGRHRRRQRRRDRARWSRRWSSWATAGSRSWPGRRRCSSRASGWPGYRRGLAEAGIAFDERLVVSTGLQPRGRRPRRRRAARRRGAVHRRLRGQRPARARGARSGWPRSGSTSRAQVSVAGFDDIPTAAMTTPGLSTVRLPLREIGRRGVRATRSGCWPGTSRRARSCRPSSSCAARPAAPPAPCPRRCASGRCRSARVTAERSPAGSCSSPAAAAGSAPRSPSRPPRRAPTVAVHYHRRRRRGASATLERVREAGADGASASPPTSPTAPQAERARRARRSSGSGGSTAWSTTPGRPRSGRSWRSSRPSGTRSSRTDLTAAFHTCRAVLPSMVERGERHHREHRLAAGPDGRRRDRGLQRREGRAHRADPRRSPASSGRAGIRVNAVAPGVTITEMTTDLVDSEEGRRRLRDMPLGRFGRADEVADAVIFLLSDAAEPVPRPDAQPERRGLHAVSQGHRRPRGGRAGPRRQHRRHRRLRRRPRAAAALHRRARRGLHARPAARAT